MRYFDHAYLSAKFAHCFRALGQAKQAERFAVRSLHMDGAYVRGKAFNLSLLASAYAQQGEYERACVVGGEALALTARLKSARAVRYLRDLRSELSPHRDRSAVRQFALRVDATLTGRR